MEKSKPTISREKAELIYRKVLSGGMTLNEARKEYGLPPIKDGDVLLTKALSDNKVKKSVWIKIKENLKSQGFLSWIALIVAIITILTEMLQ